MRDMDGQFRRRRQERMVVGVVLKILLQDYFSVKTER